MCLVSVMVFQDPFEFFPEFNHVIGPYEPDLQNASSFFKIAEIHPKTLFWAIVVTSNKL